ncbi:MAG: efflux RND transporter periplasmic adaptor subunit [Pseudomonadota bacterium]
MKTICLLILAASLAACSREPAAAPDAAPEHEPAESLEHTGPISGIETVAAGPRPLRVSVSTYGTLVLNAERTRNVSARFAGLVRSVTKSPGDPVAAGETLALVESNESLQVYAVKSPIAGVLTARNVSPGETVESQSLFTVSDLSTLWAELAVFPRQLARVRRGQTVLLRSGDGAQSASGKISHIAPVSTGGSQAIMVRVPVDNSSGSWRPGLNLSAEIVVAETLVAVAVQATALQTVDGQRAVFVPHDGGFAPRPVQEGLSDDAFVEITAGLAAGELYVPRDSFLIKAELEKAGAAHEH